METSTRMPARDRVLEVADRLFYSQGIHAVGVDTIVAEAGTAKTTLYSHFKSKDDLVVAYLRSRSESWLTFLDAQLAAHPGPASERALHVYDLLADWFRSSDFRGCPFINACAEFDPSHPASKVSAEHRSQLLKRFVTLAVDADAAEPDAVAAQLMLLYDAAMVTAHIDHDPDAAASARRAAAVLLDHSRRATRNGS